MKRIEKIAEEKTGEKVINAQDKVLGRLASEIAVSLMGKTRASFERHIYTGLKVKVINASQIKITPKKLAEISHVKYSGHRGGLKVMKGAEIVQKKGLKELVELAVFHMLPGNKLRREMLKNLNIEN